MDHQSLFDLFFQHFGKPEQLPAIYFAPGRVNLIGEHTDYNDGFVLPAALDRHMCLAYRPRSDGKVRVAALDLGEQDEADITATDHSTVPAFLRYIVGPGVLMRDCKERMRGFDAVLSSTIPIGGGLSSSAALLVAAALAFMQINDLNVSRAELADLCARSERHFSGAQVGIMDQFTSLHGKADCALLLDCRSLEYRHIPFPADELAIVVADTRVKHELSGTPYNQRRRTCEEVIGVIARKHPEVRALRDVDENMLESIRSQIDEVSYRRARHVISENARTLQAAQALEQRNVGGFGELVSASHESLRDDYEVSCEELNVMVEAAHRGPGCVGARMMGGGFGGCVLVLTRPGDAEEMMGHLKREYEEATGIEPNIFLAQADDGARVEPLA